MKKMVSVRLKKFKKLAFALAILCVNFFSLFSQVDPLYSKLPMVISPSGDAAALGRYGDYPISYNTGVPSISIPVYEIKLSDFTLPISISYHASGNRVDDISSVVGLGWVLNAGGCITRTLNSLPDEGTLSHQDAYRRDYLTREEVLCLPDTDDRVCALRNMHVGQDLESDIYSFNFNGYSGQFRYASDSSLVLTTYDDIKITGGPVSGFTINTPDGSKYWFYNGDSVVVNFISHKTSWYLNQVITPNNDTIKFKYSHSYPVGTNLNKEHRPGFNCSDLNTSNFRWIEFTDYNHLWYLESIIFRNGTINLAYLLDRKDLRPQRLESISISDLKGAIIKKLALSQSYFVSDYSDPITGSTNIYNNRLRLDTIKILDPIDLSIKQMYRFGYNTTKLPPYFESFDTPNSYYSQDLWGYFNNAGTNTHLIPIGNPCTMTAANRVCNGDAMQATVLNKIFYPTGGRTEYEYEPNKNRGGSISVGGLRIKTIKNYSDSQSSTPVLIRSYEYPGGGFTTQWLMVQNSDPFLFDRWFYLNLSEGYTFNYCSRPVGSITRNNGGTVLYEKVWEFTGIQKDIKTEYNFDVTSEENYSVPYLLPCDTLTQIIYPPSYYGPQLKHHYFPNYYKDKIYNAGQLTSQIDYKKTENDYEEVRRLTNTWSSFHVQDKIVGIKIVPVGSIDPGSCVLNGDPDCMYQYFDILWQTGVKKITKSEEILYNGNSSVTRTTYYKYGKIDEPKGHTFLTNELETTSANDLSWKIYHYLPDLFESPTGVYQVMLSNNMIKNPHEVILGRSNNNDSLYLSASVMNYALFADIPRIYQIKKMQLEIPSNYYTSLTDSRLKSELTLDSYDLNGNILNFSKNNNIPTSYIWGYNKIYPVAKATNAKNLILYTNDVISGDIGFQSNTFDNITRSFTSSIDGNITFTISYGQNPGANKTANFSFYLTGPQNQVGTICVSSGASCGSSQSTVTFTGMPSGNYSLVVHPNINDPSSAMVHFTYSYNGQIVSGSSISEIYYEGFEEYAGATATSSTNPSFAGRFFKTGPFEVPFSVPNSRSYIIEYHFWNGTEWINARKPYTNSMTINDGSAVDEVRVYPSDATMVTYTYDPLIGVTSITDENNVITYYEYDSFGRLQYIKDHNKSILKAYDYHYNTEVNNP